MKQLELFRTAPPKAPRSKAPRQPAIAPLVAARRDLLKAQADRVEMRLRQERGELVNREELVRMQVNWIRDCRRELEAIPGQLAQDGRLTTAQLVQVEDVIRDFLTQMADAG